MIDQASVLIVGAGPAGLVLDNLLQAAGVDTLILERASREQAQTRARAGFLGANSARVLAEHGLATGMLHNGRPHGTCAFRAADGEFELNYGKLGRGEAHTVYPQQDLVTDVDTRTATVRYRDANGIRDAHGRFLAGCDGSHGATRATIPAAPARRHVRDHGVAWLAVLVEAAQSMAAVTYAIHDNGFAGHMARSPQMTRYYLQVPADDDPAAWTDERIWAELAVRMRVERFGALRQGRITERRIVHLRSEVVDPIQYMIKASFTSLELREGRLDHAGGVGAAGFWRARS